MKTRIKPTQGLNGTISMLGDKSISHRAALFASLSNGQSRIDNFLDAGVTRVLLNSLKQLGVEWSLKGNTLFVQGKGLEGLKETREVLYCGNSATTFRLLAGLVAAAGLEVSLDGSEGLRKRPMKRIIDPLLSMGVPVKSSEENTAPLIFSKRDLLNPLEGQNYLMEVASAQVKTCILLAGLGANSATHYSEPSLSRDHTERMFQLMGVELTIDPVTKQISLSPSESKNFNPIDIKIPGDISSAAFIIVAALITPNSHIRIENVGLNPTRTGLLDVLIKMGADIAILDDRVEHNEPLGTIEIKTSKLRGIEIDGDTIVRMIDEFPIFAVAAVCSEGKTIVRDAKELRFKETDRISVLCNELIKLGININEKPDGFEIEGGRMVSGGTVNGQGDHRLAMSLSILGLVSNADVVVEGSEIIEESFPNFYQTLNSIGADCSAENKTYNFGLVGFPISQSHSPIIHRMALEEFGLEGSYKLFRISPNPEGKTELENILADLKSKKLDGINITIPHKQNVLRMLDQLGPSAEAIGAVNTISLDRDILIGDNTDAPGFLSSLNTSQLIRKNRPKTAIIFGAGGSARAVVYALATNGWDIYVASRRKEQAEDLIHSMISNFRNTISAIPIELSSDAIKNVLNKCHLLINTTPVGMFPNIDKCPWPVELDFPDHLNVYDLIYNPGKTMLCKLAEAAGAKSCGGIGMLIEQAALSFEIWTGKSPNRANLTKSLLTKL